MNPTQRSINAHEVNHDRIAKSTLTQQERAILAHAHAHNLDGEGWGDTEAMFGRDWILTDAKAEWLAEQHPDVDPELTKYYAREELDFDELDRKYAGCGKRHASEWVQNDDGDYVRADSLDGREFDSA